MDERRELGRRRGVKFKWGRGRGVLWTGVGRSVLWTGIGRAGIGVVVVVVVLISGHTSKVVLRKAIVAEPRTGKLVVGEETGRQHLGSTTRS